MLSCSDCLARYSDYMDGVMDAGTTEQWRAHVASCPECSRYERVLRQGLKVLHAQPQFEPSSDFFPQLYQRLGVEEHRLHTRPVTSMAAASVAVAAMLAFAAWIPVFMLADPNTPAIAASQPASAVATEIAWHAEGAVVERSSGHIHLTRRDVWSPHTSVAAIEPQYTPVILESPIAPPSYNRAYSYGQE